MAELNIFHYHPANSVIHRMDARFKLIWMLVFNIICTFASSPVQLALLTIITLTALSLSQLQLSSLLKEIKSFLVFMVFIILFQTLSTPGKPILDITIWSFTPTYEGFLSSLTLGWRLLLIILVCNIFISSTSLSTIRNAIQSLLQPLPFINEAKVATMFSLLFVVIPVILDQALEISDAQQSRCIALRKNYIQKLILFCYPLLLNTFLKADQIVTAMEARCYSEFRTRPTFNPTLSDWYLFLSFTGTCLIILFF
ncbi:MAG TPA: energy-coupling factor transporter transmembrane component T [Bacillota bacterium]|jgi:biotin transport system permease protein|nr:energy-coupling factor transporter transmembrane component T [Bacillota bacterium]HOL09040.1 energy-coupling factor transporter transmembrane component T [Bacillota bacterium]HPO96715.1 energy-coupling factor transporter transmembrane component T [Bacillota bacterium]